MKFAVIFKNKETQEEEVGELFLPIEDVACFYKDSYGTFIVTKGGRSYRVKENFSDLEALIR